MMTQKTATSFDDGDLVLLRIERKSVELGYDAGVLSTLMEVTDSPERIRKFKGQVVLEFCGYDEDPREVYAIPEIRQFFQQLTKQWPYWLWFIYREEKYSQLPMILQLLTEPIQDGPQGSTRTLIAHWQVFQALSQLARGLKAMCDANAISAAEQDEVVISTLRAYGY